MDSRPASCCDSHVLTVEDAFVCRCSADDKTLQDYNVAAGGTIHMVLQLRGGN